MKFSIKKADRYVQVSYAEDKQVYDSFFERWDDDDRYRIIASYNTPKECGPHWPDGNVHVCLQHLKISDPPYAYGSQPGRIVDMTPGEFSELVDGLVELRDRIAGKAAPSDARSALTEGGSR